MVEVGETARNDPHDARVPALATERQRRAFGPALLLDLRHRFFDDALLLLFALLGDLLDFSSELRGPFGVSTQ